MTRISKTNQWINSFTHIYLQFGIVIGLFLYDYIGKNIGFTYTDEILSLVLLLAMIHMNRINTEFKVVSFVFLFYLLYSLAFGVAKKEAIIVDAVILLKPFIGFYAAYNMGMNLNHWQKKHISRMVLVIAIPVCVAGIVSYDTVMYNIMGHPSRFATLFQVLGMIYLICSPRKKKDLFIVFLLWSFALLSLRSKSYAFFAASVFLFFFFDADRLRSFRLSTLFIVCTGISLLLIVAWEKFQFYFLIGSQADYTESFARPALYQVAFLLLKDYFPFGPGFGSYASFASAEYYSPLYTQYNLDMVQGLSQQFGSFICDTFFPQLAQFGVVGTFLFFYFFWKRYKNAMNFYRYNHNSILLKSSMIIILFFMIESTVDTTFTHNRGMIMMVIWGMILSESKREYLTMKYNQSSHVFTT